MGMGRFTGYFPRPTIQGLAWKQQKTSHDKLQLIWKTSFWSTQKWTTCFVHCSCGYDFTMMWSQGHHWAPRMYGSKAAWLLGLPKQSGHFRSKKLIVKEGLEWKSHWIWYTLIIMGILSMQKTSKYTNDITWYIFEMLPLPVTVTFFHFVLGDLDYCNLYFPLFFFGGASRTRCIYIYIYTYLYTLYYNIYIYIHTYLYLHSHMYLWITFHDITSPSFFKHNFIYHDPPLKGNLNLQCRKGRWWFSSEVATSCGRSWVMGSWVQGSKRLMAKSSRVAPVRNQGSNKWHYFLRTMGSQKKHCGPRHPVRSGVITYILYNPYK